MLNTFLVKILVLKFDFTKKEGECLTHRKTSSDMKPVASLIVFSLFLFKYPLKIFVMWWLLVYMRVHVCVCV